MNAGDAARDAASKATDRALAGIDWDQIGPGGRASPRAAAGSAVYNTLVNLRPEDVPDLVAEVRAADPLRALVKELEEDGSALNTVNESEYAVQAWFTSRLRAALDATAYTTRSETLATADTTRTDQ